ncbi:2-hydroxyacid dehydrogenase [Falsirhodobacter algicola]|uniref:Glyoxylate/hydroxypyruvate reductase A n=1 Tax=Falsirhodobacter algicola TaxID=2692330 RepID=A0A8J8SLQ8_9RHOB|nr:glyoxylate/hydroxypyruvate reductase A [Falsirhodobacter algicola]QUS36674.1 glyoxylate/hydroxypyruvate reductase A [Falsirhodobacter algicola]
MTLTVLFSARPALWDDYRTVLPAALSAEGIAARLVRMADPAEVDYIVYAPNDDLTDFAPFTRAKAVLSLFAGVERIVGNPTLTQPLCRMVDPALCEGMVEWVTAQVLRHHLWLDRNIGRRAWVQEAPPLARDRRVTMLGLGELGLAAARMLRALNFRVTGWSRSPKTDAGFPTFHGEDGLKPALEGAEIVVTLLPDTPATRGILDARSLGWLAPGAAVINPGRGPLIEDAALLAALDAGQVGHATLDVFHTEPLPPEHPFWARADVTVSPHIAAVSRPATAATVIAANIRRAEAGETLLHRVDRARGY